VRPNRQQTASPECVGGVVRLGKRTKDLTKLMNPGEIAVIEHADIDRVAAEGLVRAKVGAVINNAASISGRYPNGGPLVLQRAGIPLIDRIEPGAWEVLNDGDVVTIDMESGAISCDGVEVAYGTVQTESEIERSMARALDQIGLELQKFARNTLEYIEEESTLAFDPVELPPLRTEIRGRHALVVVRGHDYREDLRALKPYIREFSPALIAVDGGADALLEVGLTPDIIIGDFDSVTAEALRHAKDLIHHVHRDGRAPGREELAAFGVEYEEFVIDGMSEDVAMLLAYEAGATLIVAVGTHATMVEFLDKGRRGMSSTFLTRLRLGPVLVDAKGVHRLYEGRVRRRDLVLLICAALVALVAIGLVSEPLRVFGDGARFIISDLWDSLTR
jgi:uncharacterized membrane-anchored protein